MKALLVRLIFGGILLPLLLVACSSASPNPSILAQTATPQVNVPNPASVYCEQQGNKLDIRTTQDGSQTGVCIFPDGSECDEWAYFRGECQPTGLEPTATPFEVAPVPTAIPTALPFSASDYESWWTYTHPVYNFSLMLPPDWVVDETAGSDPLMNGYLLTLHPTNDDKETIRMTFRRVGEEVLLWPTGVGSGEFIPQGTLEVAGQPARRILFVCPTGEISAIWYHEAEDGQPNILRGDLEFGFIYGYPYCEPGFSLGGKVQRVGEMIISSLKVP